MTWVRVEGFFFFAFLAWTTVTFTLCHVTPYHTGMAHAPIRTACKRRGPKKKEGVAALRLDRDKGVDKSRYGHKPSLCFYLRAAR